MARLLLPNPFLSCPAPGVTLCTFSWMFFHNIQPWKGLDPGLGLCSLGIFRCGAPEAVGRHGLVPILPSQDFSLFQTPARAFPERREWTFGIPILGRAFLGILSRKCRYFCQSEVPKPLWCVVVQNSLLPVGIFLGFSTDRGELGERLWRGGNGPSPGLGGKWC